MKENRTRIAIILDRSGSMESVRESTIKGINEFVKQQRNVPGEVTLKLVKFDNEYDVVWDKNLSDIPEFTQADFVPRGMTALYDAQGRTIAALGQELAAMPEHERPSKVIVMTLTDGLENASKEYTLQSVSEMIKEQREKYNWEFVFLGANQDAVKTAAKMNIPQHAAITYNANSIAMQNVMASAINYVTESRMMRSAAFSTSDRTKAVAKENEDQDDHFAGIVGSNSSSIDWSKLVQKR